MTVEARPPRFTGVLLAAALTSVALNSVLFALAQAQGIPLGLPTPGGTLPLSLALVFGLTVALVFLVALLWLACSRWSRRPATVFRPILFVFLLVALAGPLSQPDLGRRAKLVLNLMQMGTLIVCLRAFTAGVRPNDARP